jgi:superfamily I DNA and/or RNA helicase
VLVGDHKQLPPVVQSQAAKQGGLGTSLFERLLDAGAPSAMLQVGSTCQLRHVTNQHGCAGDQS